MGQMTDSTPTVSTCTHKECNSVRRKKTSKHRHDIHAKFCCCCIVSIIAMDKCFPALPWAFSHDCSMHYYNIILYNMQCSLFVHASSS